VARILPHLVISSLVEFSGFYTALNKGGCALREIVNTRLAGSHDEFELTVASC
jgi:hypothetical protein